MVVIRAGHRVILREQIPVVTAFCVAAAGSTTRGGTCEYRIATAARPTTAATATVSASPFKHFVFGTPYCFEQGNKNDNEQLLIKIGLLES